MNYELYRCKHFERKSKICVKCGNIQGNYEAPEFALLLKVLPSPPFYRNVVKFLPLSWYWYHFRKWVHWEFGWHSLWNITNDSWKGDNRNYMSCGYCSKKFYWEDGK